jgi:hypothetical protein
MTTYVAAGPLVNYFFYKALLENSPPGPNIPLDFGKIYFYADEDHSVILNSYSDVSDPNNPVVNPWPLRLGGQGDCGVIYLEDRLYFIEIYSKNDVLQWTINHFPPGGASGGSENDALNYIPNGQFLLHNDLPATDDFDAGEIRQAITPIAPGGWTFERPESSTATDMVTFERYDEYTSSPASSPRYSVRLHCTDPDSEDGYKRFRVTFPNVNRFASATQRYTMGFTGKDNLDTASTIEFYVTKNFGTGGSDEVSTLIETFSLTSNYQAFSISFIFGTNDGKVIGTNNDDFVALDFRLRTDEEIDVNLVDFLQESGNIINPVYPETPQRFDVKEALGGGFPVPAYDGSDFLLSPILTAEGWVYDDSVVGSIMTQTTPEVPLGWVEGDGAQYETAGYFPGGVPCSRLQKKYMRRNFPNPLDDDILPRYGTGADFVTAIFDNFTAPPQGGTDTLIINNNKTGSVTDFSDGTPPTGFTFHNISSGAVNTNSKGFYTGTNSFYIWGNVAGTPTISADAGTSGFTATQLRSFSSTKPLAFFSNILGAAGLAGKYIRFGNTTTTFYIWFKVDGSGVDPTPGGTGIEVDLLSGWDALTVARILTAAVSGFKLTSITTVAATSVPAGSYFNLNASTEEYYVWFEKDGSGTDPAPAGKKPIKVFIEGGNNAAQVSAWTLLAINSKYFAVPDVRGLILRGWDNGANIDLFSDGRISNSNPLTVGDVPGSFEFDDNLAHSHTFLQTDFNDIGVATDATAVSQCHQSTQNTSASGEEESRPLNMSVNYLVKY